jgi:hypothetical protein
MIRNTDKRHAGCVPAAAAGTAATAAGTFDSCRAWGFPAYNAAQFPDCTGTKKFNKNLNNRKQGRTWE